MTTTKIKMLEATVLRLLRREAYANLQKIVSKTHPAELATIFRELSYGERVRLLNLCNDPERRSEVISSLDYPIQVEFVTQLYKDEEHREMLISILENMDDDDLADLLEEMDEEDREVILQVMKQEEQEKVEELLAYDPYTAGGIMNPSFLAFTTETTAQDAISQIQARSKDVATAFYIYVINDQNQLVGVVSLRQLVTCPPETPLKDLMTPEVISVPTHMDQEEVARLVARYGFLAVPVVDDNNRLVGIITVDDIIDVMREEATEDLFKLVGVGDDIHYFQLPFTEALWPRLRGLMFPFITTFLGFLVLAIALKLLGNTQLLALALLPVYLSLGGNLAAQSSTLIVRALAVGRQLEPIEVMLREFSVGLAIGIFYGISIGVLFYLLHSYTGIPFSAYWVVSLLVLATSLTGTFLGSALPLLTIKFNLDPASVAGATVAGFVDLAVVLYIVYASYIM